MTKFNLTTANYACAAFTMALFAVPVSAETNETPTEQINILADIDYSNYSLTPQEKKSQSERTQDHQRVEVLDDVYMKAGSRNGLYWQPDLESGNDQLRIGAYYRNRRGARDGQVYSGSPKDLPRKEYVIEVRYRF